MLFIQVEPPPVQYYQYLPIVTSVAPEYICGQISTGVINCNFVYKDESNRYYLDNKAVFDQFASLNTFTINWKIMYNLSVSSGNELPSNLNILYVKVEDTYYWIVLGIIE